MKAALLIALMLTVPQVWAEKSPEDFGDKALSLFMHETLVVKPMLLFYSPDDPYEISYDDFSFKYQAVSLSRMVQTIKENELAAEIEYKKPFIVSSRIDKITRSMGQPVLRLENKGGGMLDGTVSAFFDEDAVSDLATLEKGKAVTIACDRWSYSMSVLLKECKLMSTVFDEYYRSINPKSVAAIACKKNPTKTTVVLSRLSRNLDDLDPEIKKEFYDQTMASDSFKYRGLSGDLVGIEALKEFGKVVEKSMKDIKDKKAGDFTVKDC